jgi:hypothetical protein
MKIYLIRASTGCTCCCSENFTRGPFLHKETPAALIEAWLQGKDNPLASQYAPCGRYSIQTFDAEPISGGRFIVGNQVWGPDIEDRPND